jgi:hypothetical protein
LNFSFKIPTPNTRGQGLKDKQKSTILIKKEEEEREPKATSKRKHYDIQP